MGTWAALDICPGSAVPWSKAALAGARPGTVHGWGPMVRWLAMLGSHHGVSQQVSHG